MSTTTFVDGQTPIVALWLNDVDAHTYDQVAAAHAASNVSNTPAGTIAATTVQAALNELDGDIVADTAALAAHIADTADAHDASAISVLDTAAKYTATDVEGVLAEIPILASGNWTPTATGTLNITGTPSLSGARYSRVGSIVNISGAFSANLTASGNAKFTITLPVASNFTAAYQATGSVSGYNGSGILDVDTVTDQVSVNITSSASGVQIVSFSGQYIIA